MSSCQILIDFIQKENFNKNKSIVSVIRDLPKYIEIDDLLKHFFIENTEDINEININEISTNEKINHNEQDIQMFSVNTLINIYELIEFLCWFEFKNNLNEQYKMHLTDEMKKNIKKIFDTSIKENSLLKKQDIANATRKLISRYLSGKRGDTDIGEYQKLYDYIQRSDLWRSDIIDREAMGEELYNIFEKIRKEINFITKCEENTCDVCIKIKNEYKIEDPCFQCDKCNAGLRIGHALELYELINDEVLDLEKFTINSKMSRIISNTITDEIMSEEATQTQKDNKEKNEINDINNTNTGNELEQDEYNNKINASNNENEDEQDEEEVNDLYGEDEELGEI